MSIADKYNGTVAEIQVALNEQKPQIQELGNLIRTALINSNDNLLNALLEYKKSTDDLLDSQRNGILGQFSLEEIKQHSSKIGLFLYPSGAPGESTVHSLYVSLVLKYSTKDYDQQTGFFITNPEKVKLKLQYLKEAIDQSSKLPNALTIYHDFGHAFVKLECAECSNGIPAVLAAGLYPPDNDNNEHRERCYIAGMTPEHDDDSSPHMNWSMYGLIALPFVKSSLGSGSYYYGLRYSSYAKFPKSGVESLGLKRYINNYYVHPNEKYDLSIEHTSFVAKSWYHIEHIWLYEGIDNVFHKSFNISSEAAIKVLDRIIYLANHCDSSYQYQSLKNNCLDFTQHIYSLAGLQGDHFNIMHPDGYPLNMLGAYKIFTDLKNWAEELYNDVWQKVEYLWE